MKIPKASSLTVICSALGLLGGCATEPASHLVTSAPPPPPTTTQQVAVVQQQPMVVTQPQQVVTTAVVPNSYIVVQAPPAPQLEAVPPRPSMQHIWIAGYWTWQNNGYAWMGGHWEVPPTANATWVGPRWEPEGGAVRFHEGYWN